MLVKLPSGMWLDADHVIANAVEIDRGSVSATAQIYMVMDVQSDGEAIQVLAMEQEFPAQMTITQVKELTQQLTDSIMEFLRTMRNESKQGCALSFQTEAVVPSLEEIDKDKPWPSKVAPESGSRPADSELPPPPES